MDDNGYLRKLNEYAKKHPTKMPRFRSEPTKILEGDGKMAYGLFYTLDSSKYCTTRTFEFKADNDDEAIKRSLDILKKSARSASKKSRYIVILYDSHPKTGPLEIKGRCSPKRLLKAKDPQKVFVRGKFRRKALEEMAI